MICAACSKIFVGPSSPTTALSDHHQTALELEQSAAARCVICYWLWQDFVTECARQGSGAASGETMPNSTTVFQKRPLRYRCDALILGDPGSRIVMPLGRARNWKVLELAFNCPSDFMAGNTFNWRNSSIQGHALMADKFDFFALHDASELQEFLEGAPSRQQSISLTSRLQLAGRWLRECIESHITCSQRRSEAPTRYPKRLLDISAEGVVRLWTTPEGLIPGPRLRYVSLSHCWGPTKIYTLNTGTYEALSDGLPVSKLPKTFQDAIYVARFLGVHNIWIDSLCIFQDSVADWERECVTMLYVYENALFNIAATAADRADAGCLHPRNLDVTEPCIVDTTWGSEYGSQQHVYNRYLFINTLSNEPLGHRAWVVQEVLLAPRVLYLSQEQFFWECHEVIACETYPGGLPPMMRMNWSREPLLSRGGADREKAQKLWQNIVFRFSTCKLTRASDKLVAIYGIVQLMERVLQDSCIVGMWRSALPAQLLWHSGQANFLTKPPTYRAPSWSWASLDGRIHAVWEIDRVRFDTSDVAEGIEGMVPILLIQALRVDNRLGLAGIMLQAHDAQHGQETQNEDDKGISRFSRLGLVDLIVRDPRTWEVADVDGSSVPLTTPLQQIHHWPSTMYSSIKIVSLLFLAALGLASPVPDSLRLDNGQETVNAALGTRDRGAVLDARGNLDCKGPAFCEPLGDSRDDAFRQIKPGK
ncbi:hypothetical protein PG985_005304 [Apiospora marii]|uniref:uncharacterized protein n=1 Tax=Apiospora marii TaxID=335849 RepID=UPI003130E543